MSLSTTTATDGACAALSSSSSLPVMGGLLSTGFSSRRVTRSSLKLFQSSMSSSNAEESNIHTTSNHHKEDKGGSPELKTTPTRETSGKRKRTTTPKSSPAKKKITISTVTPSPNATSSSSSSTATTTTATVSPAKSNTTKSKSKQSSPRGTGSKRNKTNDSTTTTTTTPTSAKSKIVSPSPSKKKKNTTIVKSSTIQRQPPQGWFEIYTIVEELRQDRSAPVDINGSEALPQRHLGSKVFRFQVLVCLLLSSQTKDAVVGHAIRQLQDYGLTCDNIQQAPREEIHKRIQKVGFHNTKVENLFKIVTILQEQYNGDIPSKANDIMKLPGIGPKMAYIIENVVAMYSPDDDYDNDNNINKNQKSKSAAATTTTTTSTKIPSGIGIDTHMHRIFNQLQWVSSKTPEQTRMQLESWLPKDYWSTVNVLWVGMGQEVQQYPTKLLQKALASSRPKQALKLLQRLGMNIYKEGAKIVVTSEIKEILRQPEESKSKNNDE